MTLDELFAWSNSAAIVGGGLVGGAMNSLQPMQAGQARAQQQQQLRQSYIEMNNRLLNVAYQISNGHLARQLANDVWRQPHGPPEPPTFAELEADWIRDPRGVTLTEYLEERRVWA